MNQCSVVCSFCFFQDGESGFFVWMVWFWVWLVLCLFLFLCFYRLHFLLLSEILIAKLRCMESEGMS